MYVCTVGSQSVNEREFKNYNFLLFTYLLLHVKPAGKFSIAENCCAAVAAASAVAVDAITAAAAAMVAVSFWYEYFCRVGVEADRYAIKFNTFQRIISTRLLMGKS